jgi:hypothetical protein
MPSRKPRKHDERPAHPNRQDTSDEGWPSGMPYTVYFPDGDGFRGADIEYPAPLPRVGDVVDYIDERGAPHRYRVSQVVHTLQTSAAARPSVKEGPASPNTLARTDDGQAEPPGGGGALRAGLPEVFLAPMEAAKPRRPAKRS